MPGITVGVDGSDRSVKALEWAVKYAAALHAPLTAITVHPVPMDGWTGSPLVLPQDAVDVEKAREKVDELALKLASELEGDALRPAVTVRAVNGYPAKELIDASRNSDLVVVGSRGAGGFAKMLMGSVSHQVVQHAHCPVVVVPHDE